MSERTALQWLNPVLACGVALFVGEFAQPGLGGAIAQPRRGDPLPAFDAPAVQTEPFSTIVGGVVTVAHPAVGALLVTGSDAAAVASGCTGTLVGCSSFLTAAHCLRGKQPSELRVFFPSNGIVSVKSFTRHTEYKDCPGGPGICSAADIALVELGAPMSGLQALPVTRNNPVPVGDIGTIVGYGASGGQRSDFGVKRRGAVSAGQCNFSIPGQGDQDWICWTFLNEATTCFGDSGGPYLASNGAVGGVTSGGLGPAGKEIAYCAAGSRAFDTRVRRYIDWLDRAGYNELRSGSCGAGPQAGASGARIVQRVNETYSPDGTEIAHEIVVPTGTGTLQIAVNGSGPQFAGSAQTVLKAFAPGVDLGSPPDARCRTDSVGNFAFCSVNSPEAGAWQVVVAFEISNPGLHAPFIYQLIGTAVRQFP